MDSISSAYLHKKAYQVEVVLAGPAELFDVHDGALPEHLGVGAVMRGQPTYGPQEAAQQHRVGAGPHRRAQ
jgi:hypothetical protein